MSENKKLVAIVMGSDSDWPVMKFAAQMLADFDVPYEAQVISAHRTPDLMFKFAEDAAKEGYQIIIAGAGGAAHLPGMVASKTTLPGIPVATFAIGEAGAANAGLFAVSILAHENKILAKKLEVFREKQAKKVIDMNLSEKP
ncbi:MAG: N5-carboxyaminoimidazole ribonucleotide mutase [Pseudomonadota bacterium]